MDTCTLDMASSEKCYKIVKLNSTAPGLTQYLYSVRLTPGAIISVVVKSPFQLGSSIYKTESGQVILDHASARIIEVVEHE